MRKIWLKIVTLLMCIVFLITGCGKTKSTDSEDKENITVSEENILSEDGIVSENIMAGISGVDKVFSFQGTDGSGIKYTWFYNGKQVQNPVEQKLKVEFSKENLDDIKTAANNASVGMEVKLDKMQLAAPVQLSILLTEKWDADKIILCKYSGNKVQKMEEVMVESHVNEGEECTKLTFPVTEASGTYYLLGGKTKQKLDKEAKSEENDQEKSEKSTEEKNNEEKITEERSNGSKEEASVNKKAEPQKGSSSEEKSSSKHTCTLSIECGTLLNNWDNLNKNKADFVPSDGWILGSTTVEFTPGETVYDVLSRICRDSGIQMEASFTPMYSSYYVEGINQLYEFDGGELSGWMYRVNGWYPNYGCSKYEISDGDIIEWRYTCDLGRDVGGGYMGE